MKNVTENLDVFAPLDLFSKAKKYGKTIEDGVIFILQKGLVNLDEKSAHEVYQTRNKGTNHDER